MDCVEQADLVSTQAQYGLPLGGPPPVCGGLFETDLWEVGQGQ